LEGWEYYCSPRAFHPRSAKSLTWTSVDHIATFDAFHYVDLISPRPAPHDRRTNAVTALDTCVHMYREGSGADENAVERADPDAARALPLRD
jgi:hypothetical protein